MAKNSLVSGFYAIGCRYSGLDEPTASMDAEAEMNIFNHFRALTQGRMVVLISHRFSTVRMADKIVCDGQWPNY